MKLSNLVNLLQKLKRKYLKHPQHIQQPTQRGSFSSATEKSYQNTKTRNCVFIQFAAESFLLSSTHDSSFPKTIFYLFTKSARLTFLFSQSLVLLLSINTESS